MSLSGKLMTVDDPEGAFHETWVVVSEEVQPGRYRVIRSDGAWSTYSARFLKEVE